MSNPDTNNLKQCGMCGGIGDDVQNHVCATNPDTGTPIPCPDGNPDCAVIHYAAPTGTQELRDTKIDICECYDNEPHIHSSDIEALISTRIAAVLDTKPWVKQNDGINRGLYRRSIRGGYEYADKSHVLGYRAAIKELKANALRKEVS